MRFPWSKKPRPSTFEEERKLKQERRARRIGKLALDAMATVPSRCKTQDRMVLVSYKDLLEIWDLADKVWYDL